MSKPIALRGWTCAFYLVPLAVIAAALMLLSPGRAPKPAATVSAGSSASLSPSLTPAAHRRIQDSYASLPLAFEQNQGQTDPQVKYLARGHGYTLFLTANDAVFSLHSRPVASKASGQSAKDDPQGRAQRSNTQKDLSAVVHMHLLGANAHARVEGTSATAGTANYFIGNDPSKWRTGVARYARVSYQNLYPGVNMAFHGSGRELEFDFVLAPGANPAPIGLQFSGNQGVKTDDSGDLIISSSAGNVLLHKPVAYQEQNGARQPVDARFVLKAANQVTFELGNYDRTRELVIDPSVSYAYSTYLGGLLEDDGFGIASDASGNAYVTGKTQSLNFPTLGGIAPNTNSGTFDVFVTKIAANGSSLAYSTYVGGSANDSGNAIAVDASGDAFVAGGTTSINFPHTLGVFQTALKGTTGNAFVFELNSAGNALTYSTYLGGTGQDLAEGIAVDSSGESSVVGFTTSTDFPTSTSPLQAYPGGTNNAFVTKFNSSGTALVYSTYLNLGGLTGDSANAVALDSSGNAYVTGAASGTSFHTTTGAFQTTCGSCSASLPDAFVTVIKADGSGYVYSTFLGGSGIDAGNGIAVDSSGNAYVTGDTASTDFPTKSPLQAYGGNTDAFVTKLNPTGTALVYSTYVGGSQFDTGAGIAVDENDNAYITGETNSTDLKMVNATQSTIGGGEDAFVSEINSTGSQLTFSTYLGGAQNENSGGFGAIAVDTGGGNIYVTGNTASTTGFPTHAPFPYAGGSANSGGTDAFVVKYAQTTFSLAATAPAAVSPGGSGTSTVTLTAYNLYSSPVNLSCSVTGSGSPLPACSAASSFSPPSPVTPTTGGAATTLTITTTPPSSAMFQTRKIYYAMWFPIAGLSLVGMSFRSMRSRRNKLLGFLMVMMVVAALFFMPACGGSSTKITPPPPSGGTPAGSYTVTIRGTGTDATAVTQTTQVILTVN